MKLQKVFVLNLLVVILLSAISSVSNAGIIYQIINLKDDGSGSIKLNYNGKNAELRRNNFILANFPFSEKNAEGFFTSPNTTLKKAKLDFSVKDSTYYMTVEVDFKDINKLNLAKGFSNVKVIWTGTDSGAVFNYTLLPGMSVPKFFETQSYIVNFENSVKSTNGVLKDKSVTWGNRSIKNTDFSKNVDLTATTTGKVSIVSSPTTTSGAPGENKEKSCGLFGIELPLILIGAYVFTQTRIRSKN